jgi:PAS domain S-box-containing protein
MAECSRQPFQNFQEDIALRALLEGTAAETGEGFFAALVQNLARALNTYGAWVTELLPEQRRLRALAFWLGGQWENDFEYNIADTPCEPVIYEGRLLHIPENVVQLFPDDPYLEPLGAVSYMGVPLLDVDGNVLGNLAVLDTRPMPAEPRCLALFRIFAARAAAEHQRLRAEAAVREREEQLTRIFDTAMDAIFELDDTLRVVRANSAAEAMFGNTATPLASRDFPRLFANEEGKKIEQIADRLSDSNERRQSMWIPGVIQAITAGGQQFPAEATVSRFELGRRFFYTVILRNINDRLEAERQITFLETEREYLRQEISAGHNANRIIGCSPSIAAVLRDIEQVADTDSTVLIQGETGTGKELVARAVHASSGRRDKPFVKVNCAALPASLIESELFGHEAGAFTGATKPRDGRFQLAHKGTLFLDEIGELPIELQGKLLRVLQEGEFVPLGSSTTVKVDVRILAATNRNLLDTVRNGAFREDLYYRLNVFPIDVPPLREREDDIVLLAAAFAKRYAQDMGRTIAPLTPRDIHKLTAYSWPGNVRELQNVIERAVITSQNGHLNLDRALPHAEEEARASSVHKPLEASPRRIRTAQELRELERSNIVDALEATGWRVSGRNGAATLLGENPSTLRSRMKSLAICRPKSHPSG